MMLHWRQNQSTLLLQQAASASVATAITRAIATALDFSVSQAKTQEYQCQCAQSARTIVD
jgi:hypothetical protein